MTARRLLLALTLVIAPLAVAPAAGAIPNTCPTAGPDSGTVRISEPSAGARFAGQVTVRGRATAPAGVARVELFVGEALKDFQVLEPSQSDVGFLLRFDAASVRSPNATLTVVACGGPAGALVKGMASIGIQIDRAAVTPTEPLALTPVAGADDGPGRTTRTGPLWVGAAFGLAGLAGLVAATRLSRVRGVAQSPAAEVVATAATPPRRRPDLPAEPDGGSPLRPSPAGPPAGAPAASWARRVGASERQAEEVSEASGARPGGGPGWQADGALAALGAQPGAAPARQAEGPLGALGARFDGPSAPMGSRAPAAWARPEGNEGQKAEPTVKPGAFGGVGWLAARTAEVGVDAAAGQRPPHLPEERPPGSRLRTPPGGRSGSGGDAGPARRE